MITATRPWSDPATSTGHQRLEDEWRLDAACRAYDDPELWFSDNADHRYNAIQLCRSCPVLERCKLVAANEKWGVWAGHSIDRPDPELCGECGRAFYPTQSQRHCRRSCSDKARHRRQKQRRQEYDAWLTRRAGCPCIGGCPDCEPEEE